MYKEGKYGLLSVLIFILFLFILCYSTIYAYSIKLIKNSIIRNSFTYVDKYKISKSIFDVSKIINSTNTISIYFWNKFVRNYKIPLKCHKTKINYLYNQNNNPWKYNKKLNKVPESKSVYRTIMHSSFTADCVNNRSKIK